MNLSKSWLGLNCLRPMEHSDGIFVSGIDIAADSDDPAYIHDKDDEVQAYVKDRTTDVYQFLQVPYESVMLGMLSIHWSRQSIIPKLMAIHISWSRDGVHFERPEQNTPLLDYSTIDMAKLNQRSPHVFPYATSKIDCESFVGGGILMEAHDVQDMTLVTKCTYLPFGDSASHSRAANGIINLNQFWTLRRDGFASIDTVPQEDEEVSPLYAHPDVLETKWLLSDACPTNGLGCSICLNLDTSRGGCIEVALRLENTSDWSDWTQPITNINSIEHVVEWAKPIGELITTASFKIRFRMQHPASLYSFRIETLQAKKARSAARAETLIQVEKRKKQKLEELRLAREE